jgi:hypothetical protein
MNKWAILVLSFIFLLGVSTVAGGFIYSHNHSLVDREYAAREKVIGSYDYSGQLLFETEEEYAQFKRVAVANGLTANYNWSVTDSKLPMIVSLDWHFAHTQDFPYGIKTPNYYDPNPEDPKAHEDACYNVVYLLVAGATLTCFSILGALAYLSNMGSGNSNGN